MARILVIDDEELILRTLKGALEAAGYDVVTARDGKQGLARLREQEFDLIVTDIIMPQMEGIETIREIRRTAPDIPIIAASGGGQLGRERLLGMSVALGATASIAKPFRPRDLIALIERHLPEGAGRQA
ncbi:MAG TPA: response regulator [Sphingomonadales bacterium]